MYRHYEDPHKVARLLHEAEIELEHMKEYCDEDATDILVEQYIWVETLRDRLRFAWEDEEYDEMNATY